MRPRGGADLLECDRSGADDADVVAERGQHDPGGAARGAHGRRRGPPRGPVRAAGRPERVTPPPRTTSSGSKTLTIEVRPQASATVVESHTSCASASPARAAAATSAAVGSAIAPAASLLPLRQRLARPLGDRRPGDVRLEAAEPPAAVAAAAVAIDRQVAEFAAVAHRATVQAAVDHDSASDAGRDGQVDHVPRAHARAVAMLGSGRGGAVVLEHRRPPVGLLRERRHGDVHPARQVRRREDHAALLVERSAAADPDAGDLGPGHAGLGDRARAELEEPRQHGVRAFLAPARLERERVHVPGRVDDAGGELRPADVEPERELGRRPNSAVTVDRDRGTRACRSRHQPLRPWVAMPWMKYRWKIAKRTTIGRTVTTVPAMMTSHRPSPPPPAPCWSRIVFRPSGIV